MMTTVAKNQPDQVLGPASGPISQRPSPQLAYPTLISPQHFLPDGPTPDHSTHPNRGQGHLPTSCSPSLYHSSPKIAPPIRSRAGWLLSADTQPRWPNVHQHPTTIGGNVIWPTTHGPSPNPLAPDQPSPTQFGGRDGWPKAHSLYPQLAPLPITPTTLISLQPLSPASSRPNGPPTQQLGVGPAGLLLTAPPHGRPCL